jgi:hypothetical protein
LKRKWKWSLRSSDVGHAGDGTPTFSPFGTPYSLFLPRCLFLARAYRGIGSTRFPFYIYTFMDTLRILWTFKNVYIYEEANGLTVC